MGRRKGGTVSGMGGDGGDVRQLNRCVAMGDGELGVAKRNSRCQESKSLPGSHRDDVS